jgi:deoxycytidylate deaminase
VIHSEKFQKKYMSLAADIARCNDSCYSRHLGCIIVDANHRVRGMGYNGPPAGTPHTDDYFYLTEFFWPQLDFKEIDSIRLLLDLPKETIGCNISEEFVNKYENCQICPRRLVGAGSGKRVTLCSCQHAERNTITAANLDSTLCAMYCYCGVPCIDCTGAIINARVIKEVHHLNEDDYHEGSRWLFDKSDIMLMSH